MDGLLLLARLVLAAVFVVSGIAKLLDLAGSQSAMRSFGMPESSSKVAGIALPVIEILIAVLLAGGICQSGARLRCLRCSSPSSPGFLTTCHVAGNSIVTALVS